MLKSAKYIRIPLCLTATNHLEVDAVINGVKGRFIVDTGASNTCIGMDKIDHFKLVSEQSDIKAAGAGATEMETMVASNIKIRIGKWKEDNMDMVLFDLVHVNEALLLHQAPAVDGIIGADVLKQAKAVIDYNKPCMYLKKKKGRK